MLGAGTAVAQVGYLQAVRAAESVLARSHVSPADASRANSLLAAGVACSQPEISSDLSAQPPQVGGARQRLRALDQALAHAAAPAPGAESALRRLAASPAYQREQPESPGDLLLGWVQGREAALQALACTGVLSLVVRLLEYLAVAAVAIAAAVIAYRRVRGRGRAEAEAEASPELLRRRSADERFAAADRLAARADFGAAIRELASAVATVLGGEATWEASPLTVRELFARAGLLTELRPLLRGFEDAFYGHRELTPEAYGAAAAAAAPYRSARRRQGAA
jgi:hypothetical protein